MEKRRGNISNQDIVSIEQYQSCRWKIPQSYFSYTSSDDALDDFDYSNLAESSPFTQSIRLFVGSELSGRRVA